MMSRPRAARARSTSRRANARALSFLGALLLAGGTLRSRAQEAPPRVPETSEQAERSAAAPADPPPATNGKAPWTEETLSAEDLRAAGTVATGRLNALPADAAADSVEGRARAAWSRRVDLLAELADVVEARSRVAADLESLPERTEALAAEAAAFDALGEVEAPDSVSTEGFDALNAELADAKRRLEEANARVRDRSKRLEQAAEERAGYETRRSEAEAREKSIEGELTSAAEGPERDLLVTQLANARISQRLATEALSLLGERAELENQSSRLDAQRVDYLQKLVTRIEARHGLYQTALQKQLDQEQTAKAQEAAEKERAVESADSEDARFLAQLDARAAQAEAESARLRRLTPVLSNLVEQQRTRLAAEQDRLKALQDLVSRSSDSGRVGQRLRNTYLYVRNLRRNPRRVFVLDVANDLEAHRTSRFEIGEALMTLSETFPSELEAALESVEESREPEFRRRAEELRTKLRTSLLEQQDLLNTVIKDEAEIQQLGMGLQTVIDELEQFLLPRLFWIRDAEPVGVATLGRIIEESRTLAIWARDLLQDPQAILAAISGVQGIATAVLVFLVLPVVLFFISRRLRAALARAESSAHKAWIAVLAIVNAIIVPVYVAALSFVVRSFELPGSLADVGANLLLDLAILLSLWLIPRAFFCRGRIAEAVFGAPRELTKSVERFANRIFLLALILVVLPRALERAPFQLVTMPRLAYGAFGLLAIVPLFRFLRRRSALGARLSGQLESSFIGRNWGLLLFLALATLLVAVAMDVMGFRYGAWRIWLRTVVSLLTVVTLLFLYPMVASIYAKLAEGSKARRRRRRRARPAIDPESGAPISEPEETEPTREELAQRDAQFRRFVRASFLVIGGLLLAVYWGLNRQVIRSLDGITVYEMTGSAGPEPVTVANLFFALLSFAITIWLLRNLRGIFEVVLFTRTKFDAGLRYAIVSITRYGVLFLGLLIALSHIRLDIGRLGFLMGAIGIGIGFGLQEIFSNFVSGIILLVERPVRVGDVVKIGDATGTVSRINMRATTVTDFNRLEVVIPNKDLITKPVTNWTLADKTTRIVIAIGVAYGTDPRRIPPLLMGIAEADPDVLADPPPTALFVGHGESSLDFELRCFVAETSLRLSTQTRLNMEINEALRRESIEIPFPQRDLHIRNGESSLLAAESSANREGSKKS